MKRQPAPRIRVTDETIKDPDTDRNISIAHCTNGYTTTVLGYITEQDALKIIQGLSQVLYRRTLKNKEPLTQRQALKKAIITYLKEQGISHPIVDLVQDELICGDPLNKAQQEHIQNLSLKYMTTYNNHNNNVNNHRTKNKQ